LADVCASIAGAIPNRRSRPIQRKEAIRRI
jgi:hypothetical protein